MITSRMSTTTIASIAILHRTIQLVAKDVDAACVAVSHRVSRREIIMMLTLSQTATVVQQKLTMERRPCHEKAQHPEAEGRGSVACLPFQVSADWVQPHFHCVRGMGSTRRSLS